MAVDFYRPDRFGRDRDFWVPPPWQFLVGTTCADWSRDAIAPDRTGGWYRHFSL